MRDRRRLLSGRRHPHSHAGNSFEFIERRNTTRLFEAG